MLCSMIIYTACMHTPDGLQLSAGVCKQYVMSGVCMQYVRRVQAVCQACACSTPAMVNIITSARISGDVLSGGGGGGGVSGSDGQKEQSSVTPYTIM